MTAKKCLACHRPITGRADKKFCSDACRNSYNNQLNCDTNPLIRKINNILRRNRRILFELLGGSDKPLLVQREQLIAEGFHFGYFTELFRNEHKELYYYCYDYGYRMLEDETFMVVKNKKRQYSGKRKLPSQ